jgi:hypothetical protein
MPLISPVVSFTLPQIIDNRSGPRASVLKLTITAAGRGNTRAFGSCLRTSVACKFPICILQHPASRRSSRVEGCNLHTSLRSFFTLGTCHYPNYDCVGQFIHEDQLPILLTASTHRTLQRKHHQHNGRPNTHPLPRSIRSVQVPIHLLSENDS